MKDRLSHLHELQTDTDGFSTVELETVTACEAAGFDAAAGQGLEPHLDGVLHEAQQIRLQIQQIQNDISELKEVNYQTLNQTTHDAVNKRDSNAIGMDIKHRAEAVLLRLRMLNTLRGELESERGSSDPTARIARTQYQCLGNALQEVMIGYNDTEMSYREACKRQIQRQMAVAGRDISTQELEEMMEGEEEITVFSLHSDGKTARSALQQIKSRHNELRLLERRIEGIHKLFLDVALLVEQQGLAMESIQKNVQNTEVTIQDGLYKLDRATAADKNNPFKKMFCSCFPCFYN